MDTGRVLRAIGLMSGTSMDGIDVAFIETDGASIVRTGLFTSVPYPEELRATLLGLPAPDIDTREVERQVTELQAQAVRTLCSSAGLTCDSIDVVGFHGQTIKHEPHLRKTWQLGDGQLMASLLHTVVVNDFRQRDMDNGGQGAPLAPAFHHALVRSASLPDVVAVLNIGGVSNVTLVDGEQLHACDCGPGNALIDDWVRTRCGMPYDAGGRIASAGHVNDGALALLLDNPYFHRSGPKSLDRNAFSLAPVAALSVEDGAATLAAFTAAAIVLEAQRLPRAPQIWIVTGGGRLNAYLVDQLRSRLSAPVKTAEDVGWDGDAIEAQAFGYLAVRSLRGLPLSWPETTGVERPVSGGKTWRPDTASAPAIRAVLFDLDGTLLDTAPDMVAALNVLRSEERLESLPFEDVQPFVSAGAAALVRLGFPDATEARFATLRERFLQLYGQNVAVHTRLYDGLESALTALEAKGIPWGIVTNKPHRFTEPLLDRLALLNRAKVVVSADTLPQRKPHPAPLLYAARAMSVDPAECLYIGDAERDVLAARAANMRALVVLYGYIPATDRPRDWPAHEWHATPADLIARLASIATADV